MGFRGSAVPWERLGTCFATLKDPREANTRHDLHEILVIGFCTMLCGGEDYMAGV
jgi:hypothetical protein